MNILEEKANELGVGETVGNGWRNHDDDACVGGALN
jgi:hypothetical protein